MKKNGFTLVELLAVIVILGMTITIVAVKIDKNIKDTNKFSNTQLISTIEDAAYLYAETYDNELTNLNTYNVDVVTINTLIEKGLLDKKNLKNISFSEKVIIANINGLLKTKYVGSNNNAIFLNGGSEVSIYKGEIYSELGAYIAIPNTGLDTLSSSNITSNINTSTVGRYEVKYTYSNAKTEKRTVNVLNK